MFPAVLLGVLVGVAGCTTRAGTPDEALGGLVVAPPAPAPIDVARATDPEVLGRALGLPQAQVDAALGAHTVTITSRNTVTDSGAVVEQLVTEVRIERAADGAFHAVLNNSADHGEEVVFVGGALHLRPRYARWHRRPPRDEAEPAALRARLASEFAAAWDLLAPAAALTDAGATEVAGRPARKLTVAKAAAPRAVPDEPLAQRAWRAGRSIDAVEGEVVLDAASGALLAGNLRGQISFARDGRAFSMALDVTHATIAGAAPPQPPPAEETVTTPERSREVDERDQLLRGIAPPQGAAGRAP